MITSIDEVFRTTTSPYYIVTNAYRENSSGIRVTHYLCHILNCCGFESYLIFIDHIPSASRELWTPGLTNEILHCHYLSGRKPIVICAEGFGNLDFGYGLAVRYLLNRPGFLHPDRCDLGRTDMLIAYRREIVGNLAVSQLLTVPPCDPSIFHPSPLPDRERHGRYFYFNRLLARGGSLLPETDGAIEISPRVPRSLRELAEIFKRAELLYCYEWGAIADEARMCGCPVVCIPNETILPSFDDYTFGTEGMGWGTSESAIAKAKSTVHRYYPRYLRMFKTFRAQLTAFIETTQNAAKRMNFNSCFPPNFVASMGWPENNSAASIDDSELLATHDTKKVPMTAIGLARLLWKGITRR